LGGLKSLYIANASDIVSITDTTLPVPDGILDTISMNGPAVFYKFDFEKDTASYTQELQVSGGNKYVTQSVTFSLAGQDYEAVKVLTELVTGKLVVIAETKSGVRTILGLSTALEAITGTVLNSGAGAGDFGGAVVTLQADANAFGFELAGATVIPV
jgi:tripartite-type tricarboxylate transporter receptor subunit TctC